MFSLLFLSPNFLGQPEAEKDPQDRAVISPPSPRSLSREMAVGGTVRHDIQTDRWVVWPLEWDDGKLCPEPRCYWDDAGFGAATCL